MNVSNVTSATNCNAYGNGYQTNFRQGLKDFKALAGALQSGDLAGAQSAFSDLEQVMPGLAQVAGANSSSSSTSTQTSPIAQALQSLQSALQTGDLGGAQQAFSSLQQSLQGSTGQVHRGHHHHHHSSSTSGTTSSGWESSTPSGTDSDGDSATTPVASASSTSSSLLDAQA